MSSFYASSIPCDGFWYAYTDTGKIVGKDKSLNAAIDQAEAAGFTDVILAFGHPPATREDEAKLMSAVDEGEK